MQPVSHRTTSEVRTFRGNSKHGAEQFHRKLDFSCRHDEMLQNRQCRFHVRVLKGGGGFRHRRIQHEVLVEGQRLVEEGQVPSGEQLEERCAHGPHVGLATASAVLARARREAGDRNAQKAHNRVRDFAQQTLQDIIVSFNLPMGPKSGRTPRAEVGRIWANFWPIPGQLW